MPVPQSSCYRQRPGEGGNARLAWLRKPLLPKGNARLLLPSSSILHHELAHNVVRVLELRLVHELRPVWGLLGSRRLGGTFERRRPQHRKASVGKCLPCDCDSGCVRRTRGRKGCAHCRAIRPRKAGCTAGISRRCSGYPMVC
jgi:hypothetical protein